jgi:FMN phosphatase YigB (HAD superfamily)
MNTPYKILLFDLDDTLINNKENVKHAFQNVLEKRNETYTNEKFQRRYEIDKKFWKDWQDGKITLPAKYQQETGKKSKGFLNRLRAQRILIYFNNTVSFEEAISLNNIYMHSLTEVVIAIDGAYETLEYLSSKYDILVATN